MAPDIRTRCVAAEVAQDSGTKSSRILPAAGHSADITAGLQIALPAFAQRCPLLPFALDHLCSVHQTCRGLPETMLADRVLCYL